MPDAPTLRQWIGQNRIEAVLDALNANTAANRSLNDELILLKGRWDNFKRERSMGLLDHRQESVQYANLTNSLIELVNRWEQSVAATDILPSPADQHQNPGSNPVSSVNLRASYPARHTFWVGGIALTVLLALIGGMMLFRNVLGESAPLINMLFLLLMGILAGVAFFQFMPASQADGSGTLSGFNFKLSGPILAGALVAVGGYFFLNAPTSTFGYTIYVKPQPGLDLSPNYPQPITGNLTLLLENDPKPAVIDNFAAADYKGIPGQFRNKPVALVFEGKYWVPVQDTVRLTGNNWVLYMRPNGILGHISGKVMDAYTSQPVEGASIETDGISTLSGPTGNFNFDIPLRLQRWEYKVTAFKEGYQRYLDGNITPNTGQSLPIYLQPLPQKKGK